MLGSQTSTPSPSSARAYIRIGDGLPDIGPTTVLFVRSAAMFLLKLSIFVFSSFFYFTVSTLLFIGSVK